MRIKLEQQQNAEMKEKLAASSGYHDGKKYYKKKTKGKWFRLGHSKVGKIFGLLGVPAWPH